MNNPQIKDYLRFDVLNTMVSGLPRYRIGEETRKYFKNAFEKMFKEGMAFSEISNLEYFWRS